MSRTKPALGPRERMTYPSPSTLVSPIVLRDAIRQAWVRETSADPSGWTEANPAWGQCAVTALIVQDFLGGELLRCEVNSTSHYWNKLSSGDELDLTSHQFGPQFRPGRSELRSRGYVLGFADTVTRYQRLSRSVRRMLRRWVPTTAMDHA